MTARPPSDTDWPVVGGAVLGGATAALQIGKASAVLAALGARFGVGLADTAFYLSLFSIGAAVFGGLVGLAITRIHPLKAGCGGLMLIAAGSVMGSFASDWTAMLASRVIEAFGLPLVVCSMPALIQIHAAGAQRQVAMGLWATWLPLGIALALGLSLVPDLASDWRAYLRCCAVFPFAAAVLLVLAVRRGGRTQTPGPPRAPRSWPRGTLLAVAALFALFQASYLTIQGFLPTIATDIWRFAADDANRFTGLAALCVIIGNLVASTLMGRQVSKARLYIVSMLAMAAASVVILSDGVPGPSRLAAAVVFTACAGVPPAVIWALVPDLSAVSRLSPTIVSGVLYQGAGIGQLSGPVVAGLAIDRVNGWGGAAWVTVLCAIAACAIARHVLRTRPG